MRGCKPEGIDGSYGQSITLRLTRGAHHPARWAVLRQPAVPVPRSPCLAHCLGGGSRARSAWQPACGAWTWGTLGLLRRRCPGTCILGCLGQACVMKGSIKKQWIKRMELQGICCFIQRPYSAAQGARRPAQLGQPEMQGNLLFCAGALAALHTARPGARNWMT